MPNPMENGEDELQEEGVKEDEDEDESSNSIENDDRDENDCDYVDDDESYESEEDDGSGRTLLFLCEEGQLDTALKRVREWDDRFPLPETPTKFVLEDSSTVKAPAATAAAISVTTEAATIQREIFRRNPNTGNYCLHEIVAGGTSGTSAPELVTRLVRRYRTYNTTGSYQALFKAQPKGSNGRTVLHWCAWAKTTPKILKLVLEACPEAMCLRDNKSHFCRTPLEIAQRYWPEDEITTILKSSLETYLPYRLRVCVRLSAERLFLCGLPDNNSNVNNNDNGIIICRANNSPKKLKRTAAICNAKEAAVIQTTTYSEARQQQQSLKPFDKKDRRIAGLAPRPWFVTSVLGYALQREMKGLALRILSFVGCGAKLETKTKSKRRSKQKKRKSLSLSRPATASGTSREKGNSKARKSSGEATSNARKTRKRPLGKGE